MHRRTARRLQMHSCDVCRRRKIKCDSLDERPCSACLKAGIQCMFTVGWRRQRRRSPAARSVSSTPQPGDDQQPTPAAASARDDTSAGCSPSSSLRTGGGGGSQICSCSQHSKDTAGSTVPPESEVALSIDIASNGLLRFFRDGLPSSSWDIFDHPDTLRVAYVGTHISNMTHLIKLDRPRRQYLVYPFPQYRPPIPAKPDAPRGDGGGGGAHDAMYDINSFPEKDIRDDFVDAYFAKVHPYFPIVDEADFRARYADPDCQPPLLLLHAVLLVGAHVSTHDKARQARHIVKAVLFRRAKCVFDMRHENDRHHLVQAALLFTWHLQNGDTASANSFYWLGVACRIAFGIGLHRNLNRDPAHPERMPLHDRRTWRRTWWALFQAEVMSALEHGRPCAIRAEDFDQEPLCVDDFRDPSGAVNPRVDVEYCIKNAELCHLALDIVNLSAPGLAGMSPQSLALRTGALNAQLVAWKLNLGSTQSTQSDINSTHGDISSTSFGDINLRLHYHTVVIHLYRLMADRAALLTPPPPVSEEARRIGSSASSDIIAALESLHSRDMLAQCPFTSVTALMAAAIQTANDIQQSLGSMHTMLAVHSLCLLDRVCVIAEHLSVFWPNVEGVRKVFRSLLDQFRGALNGIQQSGSDGHLAGEDLVGVDWTEILGLTWPPTEQSYDVNRGWDASILGLGLD